MAPDPVAQSLHAVLELARRLERDHLLVRGQFALNLPASSTRTFGAVDPAGTIQLTAVEAAANQRIHAHIGDYQTHIERAALHLAEADSIRERSIGANTAPIATTERCDGGAQDWADPTCERNAVTTLWIDGTQHQLCQRCWDRQRQRKHREGLSQDTTSRKVHIY